MSQNETIRFCDIITHNDILDPELCQSLSTLFGSIFVVQTIIMLIFVSQVNEKYKKTILIFGAISSGLLSAKQFIQLAKVENHWIHIVLFIISIICLSISYSCNINYWISNFENTVPPNIFCYMKIIKTFNFGLIIVFVSLLVGYLISGLSYIIAGVFYVLYSVFIIGAFLFIGGNIHRQKRILCSPIGLEPGMLYPINQIIIYSYLLATTALCSTIIILSSIIFDKNGESSSTIYFILYRLVMAGLIFIPITLVNEKSSFISFIIILFRMNKPINEGRRNVLDVCISAGEEGEVNVQNQNINMNSNEIKK